MGDSIEDLIARIDSLSLEQIHAGEFQRVSLRQSQLGAALNEIALRLITQPNWNPAPGEIGEIGLLVMNLLAEQTCKRTDASRKLELGTEFISNVRRALAE